MTNEELKKATVEDVVRQVFLIEETKTNSLVIPDDFNKLELKALRQRKVPLMIIHSDSDEQDLVLLPLKALMAMFQHSMMVAIAKELMKQNNKIRKNKREVK